MHFVLKEVQNVVWYGIQLIELCTILKNYTRMKNKFLFSSLNLTSVCLLIGSFSFSQTAAEIDPTFGASGYVFTDHEANTGEKVHAVIALSDDKLITAGNTESANDDILIAKYTENGTLDNTFGNNGKVIIDLSIGEDQAHAVKELFDGKLLIAGHSQTMNGADGFVMRLNADGSVDNSFGTNGTVFLNSGMGTITLLVDIHVKNDNSIFVAGTTANLNGDPDFSIFKLTQGGGLDVSFSGNGVTLIDNAGENDILESMTVASDGTIYLVGHTGGNNGLVVRLAVAGNPHPAFATNGLLIYDAQQSTQILLNAVETPDNKLMVVGFEGSGNGHDGILLKINPDGTFDTSFSGDGKQISDIGTDNGVYLTNVTIVDGDRILATGTVDGLTMQGGYALMMDQTGSASSEFAPGGDEIYTMPISTNSYMPTGLAIQSDGKIVLGGFLTSQDFVGENMFMFRIHSLNTAFVNVHEAADMRVYPNPAKSNFSISTISKVEKVELVDLSGRLVQVWESYQSLYSLDSAVVRGVYYLNVQLDGEIFRVQFHVE